MLTIKPVQDKAEQQRLCGLCRIPYEPEAFSYVAHEGDTFIGVCQFSIRADGGHLLHLVCADGIKDKEALFLMGRAVMNFLDECEVALCYCASSLASSAFLSLLGFKEQTEEGWCADLHSVFHSSCGGRSVAEALKDCD